MVPRERAGIWSGDDAGPDWTRLSRLLLWGAAAAMAVALAVIAAQTDIGSRRFTAIFAAQDASKTPARPAVPTATQIVPQSFDAEGEIKRLSEGLRLLAADRDRLIARLVALERNVDDMTGSIVREPAPATVAPTAAPTPPPPPAQAHVRAATVAGVVAAALPPAVPEPASTEFGADIGGAPTMDGLRTLWSVLRTNYPQYFEGMRPVVAIRELRPGAVELRLIVGPLASAGAAARMCASLATAGLSCQATAFEGQRLALR
jgi:hypothetical protein